MDARIDIADILRCGDKRRVTLLQYCVMSMMMEPLFVFLVQEYRWHATHDAALALYDVFCDASAPARIRACEVLPPRNLQLASTARSLREQSKQLRDAEESGAGAGIAAAAPYHHLFDFVVDSLRNDPSGSYARVQREFDPDLTPEQNLPGGRMSPAQRHFVEGVWRPRARPRLVEAGFWRISTIG